MIRTLPLALLLSCGPPDGDAQSHSSERSHTPSWSDHSSESQDQHPPTAPPSFLSGQAIAAITDAVDAFLDLDPETYGVHVIDLENGQILYTRDPDRPLKPASNAKLFTTAASLELLGVDHRPEVEVWGTAPPSGATLGGDLIVIGEHDGTWSSWMHRDPDVPADRIAAALHRAGVRTITGDLVVRGEYVYEPHRFGTYGVVPHRDAAATALREALTRRGITVHGANAPEPGFERPSAGSLLHTWRGSSLEAVSAPINRISHNELTDLLSRHLGYHLQGQSTYAGGEAAMAGWLADQGLDTSSFALFDGSGLSHSNRVTARLVAELLQSLDASPSYGAFVRSLAVASGDGTLAGRLNHPDTARRFLGKTGTLRDTIATSGILHHRHDGHRYAIAILTNDVSDASSTRAVHDAIIGIFAQDWRSGPARPDIPRPRTMVSSGNTTTLTVDSLGRTDHLEAWISPDGATWSRAQAFEVRDEAFTIRHTSTHPVHLRLIAVAGERRSDPSTTFAIRRGPGPRLLVVDGYERWFTQQRENPLGAGHDFVSRTVEAARGYHVDTASNRAVIDGEILLEDYDGVLWLLGEESTEHVTFTPQEQQIVRAYVEAGGAFIASGSEIGWDLEAFGDAQDIAFLREVLGGRYLADSSETYMIEPAEARFALLDDMSFLLPGHMLVYYPDLIEPVGDARTAIAYAGGTGGGAITRRLDAPVIWAGFPIEAIDDAVDRETLVLALLDALGL
ncbi:MAG: hypothetical protein EA397_10375 [Deltaproteobacteria bacterium]|nr:MAG: hypothetical protein EA397_10375 [Deltaproteobacteria bacterium]